MATEEKAGKVPNITSRQAEVLSYLVSGATNREIAEALGVTVDAIKMHLARLCRKVGVRKRAALAVWATLNGNGKAQR